MLAALESRTGELNPGDQFGGLMSSPLDEYGMVVRHERSDSSVTQHLGLLSYRTDRTAGAEIPSAVPGGDQLAHRAADMGVPVIPHQWTGERDAGLLPSPRALHPVRAMGGAGGLPRIRTEKPSPCKGVALPVGASSPGPPRPDNQ